VSRIALFWQIAWSFDDGENVEAHGRGGLVPAGCSPWGGDQDASHGQDDDSNKSDEDLAHCNLPLLPSAMMIAGVCIDRMSQGQRVGIVGIEHRQSLPSPRLIASARSGGYSSDLLGGVS
jgi:hypothetical protein